MHRKKKIFILIVLALLLFIFSQNLLTNFQNYNSTSSNYYIERSYDETLSKNYVTAIYLDYRLFDSIFEAATLFVVAAGILFLGNSSRRSK